jgi:hypothetical protein
VDRCFNLTISMFMCKSVDLCCSLVTSFEWTELELDIQHAEECYNTLILFHCATILTSGLGRLHILVTLVSYQLYDNFILSVTRFMNFCKS